MPSFKYKALDKLGKPVQGVYDGNDEKVVYAMIKENNLYPLSVEEIAQSAKVSLSVLQKVKTKDLAIFCRQFYTMINAGSSIVISLNILKEQTTNKAFKKVITQMNEDVQTGITLSEAMEKHKSVFPELLINMVAAGEVSGNLDGVMERMALHFEKENKINQKVKSAMVYPIILTIVAVAAVTGILIFVMPTFMTLFTDSGVELPAPTKILMGMSKFLQKRWYIILIGIIIIVLIIKIVAKSKDGQVFFDKLKLTMPGIKGLNQKIVVSRVTRSMATILNSGVPLVKALEVVSRVTGNVIVEQELLMSREKISKGIPFSESIEGISFFPNMLTSMVKIGEESGCLDEMMDKTANFYDDEVETAIQKMTTMIEPIMILIMGILIGCMLVAMIMPMFKMYDAVG